MLVSSIAVAARLRLLTVRADAPLREVSQWPDVLAMVQANGLVHIPVVDTEGKPSGVVNARDALRELMLEGQYEEALLRDYVMGVGYH